MKTVITHFYNEEYLLPWWLVHHRQYFDFGVLIDYGSTDRSVEICQQLCPHWQVVPSAHADFDCLNCDMEVMHYERQIEGWRIALTTTEFLVGNLDKLMVDDVPPTQYHIPQLRFTEWRPYESLDYSKPLWEQIKMGIPYQPGVDKHDVYCRSLHNFNNIVYGPGRHWGKAHGSSSPDGHNKEAWVFHYGNAIVGYPMIKRRLQLQERISARDRSEKRGTQHYIDELGMDPYRLYQYHLIKFQNDAIDCSYIIDQIK